jgi:hypothetical protein
MVNYTCPTCNKEFKKKSHFIEHTEQKKKPCDQNHTNPAQNSTNPAQNSTNPAQKPPIPSTKTKKYQNNQINDININIEEKSCLFCGLVFTRKDTVKRHMDKYCKVKKLQKEEKETILELLIEKDRIINELKNDKESHCKQMDELKKMILELNKKMDKQKNKAHTQNINKGVINNNIIIPQSKLVNFGEEDVKNIPKEVLKDIVKLSGYPALVSCFNAIHNNKDYPQGMNSYLSDISRNKGMVWTNGEWVQAPVKKIFNIVMNKIDTYINHCEVLIESGEYNTKKDPDGSNILDQLQTRIKKYYDRYLGDDESVSPKACKEFEKTVRDNIVAELCSIRKNVMNNYNKILEDLEKNNNIANKELTQTNIKNDRDKMINKIDDIKEKTENKHRFKNIISNDSDSDSDSEPELEYDSDLESDSDFDSPIIQKSKGKKVIDIKDDDEYVLKEVTLASGLKAKKWCKK